MLFNKSQLEAIQTTKQAVAVLAGAGSGKTALTTAKIDALISQGIPAESIYATTFTNKAAKEMQSRVSGKAQISTMHQLGYKILLHSPELIERNKKFQIISQSDSLSLIANVLEIDLASNAEIVKNYQSQISYWKNYFGRLPKDYKSYSDLASVVKKYNNALTAFNAVDFDDLITLSVTLLQEQVELRHYWQDRIAYLLIDEFQDTNFCQFELIKMLSSDTNITVVGDDAQAIYSWRGAISTNINKFIDTLPDVKVIKLEQNYRSSNTILNAANKLITYNSDQVASKKLWSTFGDGDKIKLIIGSDEQDELDKIVDFIKFKSQIDKVKLSDIAILYRSNFQALAIEKVLSENGISCSVSGQTSFFEKNEVKDLIAYMQLLEDPDHDLAFLRVVNTPKREIGSKTLEVLANYAKGRELSLFSAIFELGLQQVLPKKSITDLNLFANFILKQRGKIYDDNFINIMLETLDIVDYDSWLQQNSASTKSFEKKLGNKMYLINWLDSQLQAISPSELLQKLQLMQILDSSNKDQVGDSVHLQTIHSAKGLEFDVVFIVGMFEESFPHKNNMHPDLIEEERRLAYVAITRAKKQLYLSYPEKQYKNKEHTEVVPSRFIQEMGLEYISEQSSSSTSKKQVQALLSDLKVMLNND